MSAIKYLKREYKNLLKNPDELFSICPTENFFTWDVKFFGPPDTIFYNGIFDGKIIFPQDFPNSPPEIKFTSEMFHPNIYTNGKVCISILHDGVDQWGYESIQERWNPTHSISSILISIISMLVEPNLDSPANVDASKLCKENPDEYKKIIYKIVSKSLE